MLRRLLASGLAYQSPAVISGVLALGTLPLYSRYLSPVELGRAEALLVWIILASIVVRAGLQEAFLRQWFAVEGDEARAHLARRVLGTVLMASTAAALAAALAAPWLAEPLAGGGGAAPIRAAALGLWAFTNLELLNALLRAQEARRTYFRASLANVGLTVLLTVLLVVGAEAGTTGYLLGNYLASILVALGVAWSQRRWLLARGATGPSRLGPLARFGLATIPAELSLFGLNVVDRTWLIHSADPGSAGQYALAAKLATLVIVLSRALQAAWPPLAYGLTEAEAPRAYATALRASLLGLGAVVVALTLLREPIVALLADPAYAAAAGVLPWLALAWALWGLVAFVASMANRGGAPQRSVGPALAGLGVNVLALWLLVPRYGAAGAGAALVLAYVVMLGLGVLATRRLVRVQWSAARVGRIALAFGAVVAVAEWAGADEQWWVAVLGLVAVPAALWAVRAVDRADVAWARGVVGRREANPPSSPDALR